jgi:hypothetical protein
MVRQTGSWACVVAQDRFTGGNGSHAHWHAGSLDEASDVGSGSALKDQI